MGQLTDSSCSKFCRRTCWCIFVPALLCFFVAFVGYYSSQPCDTQVLADVDNSAFIEGVTDIAGHDAAGTCTLNLSFEFEGQDFNQTLSTACDSCEELQSPAGAESVELCFRQSPTDPGIRIIQSPTSNPDPRHKWRIGLGIVGIIAAVSLAAILVMSMPWSCLCGRRARKPSLASQRRSKTGWQAFNDEFGGQTNIFESQLGRQSMSSASPGKSERPADLQV